MKNHKIDEALNNTVKMNKRAAERFNIDEDSFGSVMFLSSTTDKANEAILSYLTNEFGANVITVTPIGYEIQREKTQITIENAAVFPVIYPGDEMTDNLKKEKTILFLPNLHQMNDQTYRRLLLDMAMNHVAADPRNGEGGFATLDGSFFAVATVGRIPNQEMFELTVMDAKNTFRCIDLDEIMIDTCKSTEKQE